MQPCPVRYDRVDRNLNGFSGHPGMFLGCLYEICNLLRERREEIKESFRNLVKLNCIRFCEEHGHTLELVEITESFSTSNVFKFSIDARTSAICSTRKMSQTIASTKSLNPIAISTNMDKYQTLLFNLSFFENI